MNRLDEEKIDKLSVFIAENFGILKTEISSVKNHLARINGKVAEHESKIYDHDNRLGILRSEFDNSKRPWHAPGWVTVLSSAFTGLFVYFVTKGL